MEINFYEIFVEYFPGPEKTGAFLRKPIIYKRYITIKEGKHFAVRYELISVVVFKGSSLSRDHYFSYVLNSDDKWYKLDDREKEAVQVLSLIHI